VCVYVSYKYFFVLESDKDTQAKTILENTYLEDERNRGHSATFEEDLLKQYGIHETRKRKKTYWY
jgi:hypothetical protein